MFCCVLGPWRSTFSFLSKHAFCSTIIFPFPIRKDKIFYKRQRSQKQVHLIYNARCLMAHIITLLKRRRVPDLPKKSQNIKKPPSVNSIRHGLINYIDTKTKVRHVKNLPVQGLRMLMCEWDTLSTPQKDTLFTPPPPEGHSGPLR
jgi:hypothetical protein